MTLLSWCVHGRSIPLCLLSACCFQRSRGQGPLLDQSHPQTSQFTYGKLRTASSSDRIGPRKGERMGSALEAMAVSISLERALLNDVVGTSVGGVGGASCSLLRHQKFLVEIWDISPLAVEAHCQCYWMDILFDRCFGIKFLLRSRHQSSPPV